MSIRMFIKRQIANYFIVVTCITFLMGILGFIYEPDSQIHYDAFFSPLLFGLLGIIPSLVSYSKRELSLKQMLIRKVIQLLLLEIIILGFSYIVGLDKNQMALTLILAVAVIYIVVHVISWWNDDKKAKELNQELAMYQERIRENTME